MSGLSLLSNSSLELHICPVSFLKMPLRSGDVPGYSARIMTFIFWSIKSLHRRYMSQIRISRSHVHSVSLLSNVNTARTCLPLPLFRYSHHLFMGCFFSEVHILLRHACPVSLFKYAKNFFMGCFFSQRPTQRSYAFPVSPLKSP